MNIYSAEDYIEFFKNAGFVKVYQKEFKGTLLTVGNN